MMNYTEAMEYLKEVSTYGSVLGLSSVTEVLKRLGNPQDKLTFLHIAGTNGKGSTAAYLASILTEAGYKVGRFISPVVERYEECIQISSKELEDGTSYISKEQVAKQLTKVKTACDAMKEDQLAHPTTFEVETAMAMLEFVEQQCDLVILEVGLGGRLDATNVIQTVACSVITSISMDHMQFLGDSIEKIAYEKAGIIKPGIPVVSYPQEPNVAEVIKRVCEEKDCPLTIIKKEEISIVESSMQGTMFQEGTEQENTECMRTPLLGEHQVYNAMVAIKVCEVLKEQGYEIARDAIKKGLADTTWFGRLSVVMTSPYLIVDGAHNPDAAKQLATAVQTYFSGKKGIFVMGVFADKEYEQILEVLAPFAKRIIAVTPDNPRALSSKVLCQTAKGYCNEVIDADTVANGVELALQMAEKTDYILCFGSLSFLGEVKHRVERK